MLHTKFRGNRLSGSSEDFELFYHMWAWRPSWSSDQHHIKKIHFHVPKSLHKNWLKRTGDFREKHVLIFIHKCPWTKVKK